MHFPMVILSFVVIVFVIYQTRPPVVFVIRYRKGIGRVVRGRLTEMELDSIQEICRQNEVRSGTITALPHGRRVRMKFSGEISAGCQQQIRNLMLTG